jgi:hypothetical protein
MSVRRRQQGKLVEFDDTQPCNFSDEVVVESKQDKSETRPSVEVDIDIPAKFYMTNDLKKLLPDYQVRRKSIKNKKQRDYWEHEIDKLLTLYDATSDKYHFKLVRSVLQILEDYCIWDDKLGETKKYIAVNILKKFFDNNIELLDAVIENELENVVKSSLLRRLLSRAEIFFFAKR